MLSIFKNKIFLISFVSLIVIILICFFLYIYFFKKMQENISTNDINIYDSTIYTNDNQNIFTNTQNSPDSPVSNRFIVTNTQTQTPTQPVFIPNTTINTQSTTPVAQNNTPIPETTEQIEIKSYANNTGLVLNDIQQGLFSYLQDISVFATTTPPKSGEGLKPIIDMYSIAIENMKNISYPEILKINHEALLANVIATKEAFSSIANNPSGNNSNSWIKINESTLNIAQNIIEISDKIILYRINMNIQDPGILFLDIGSR
jgi:hypothetical protein